MSVELRDSISQLCQIADTVVNYEAAMFVESLDAADALGLLPVKSLVGGTLSLTQEKLDLIEHWISEGHWQACENPLVREASSLVQAAAMKAAISSREAGSTYVLP